MQSVLLGLVQLNNMTPNTTEITLTVTIDEANILLAGLQELPGKICNPLSQKLQLQAKAQLAEPETPPEE